MYEELCLAAFFGEAEDGEVGFQGNHLPGEDLEGTQ